MSGCPPFPGHQAIQGTPRTQYRRTMLGSLIGDSGVRQSILLVAFQSEIQTSRWRFGIEGEVNWVEKGLPQLPLQTPT